MASENTISRCLEELHEEKFCLLQQEAKNHNLTTEKLHQELLFPSSCSVGTPLYFPLT